MNSTSWLHYYQQNRLQRPEPQWDLPLAANPTSIQPLARSLSHFQLGESGKGTFLLQQAGATHRNDPDYCEALALFIREEQEHARLLQRLVERYGGTLVTKHWTHTIFRSLRHALGVGFEIQVLVIAELVGTAYYRLLEKHTTDPVLRQVCGIVLRDEERHIAFHAERFGTDHAAWLPAEGALWAGQFQAMFLAAMRVAWLDHGSALLALGASRADFFREARNECIQFLSQVALSPVPTAEQPAPVFSQSLSGKLRPSA